MNYRQNNRIKGAGTALITPFKSDGSVDYTALENVVESNIQGGIDFLCVLGTTAETPTLTEEEKLAIRKCVRNKVAGRVPLLLGFGGNNTAALVSAIKADDFEGFDAILVVAPFYNKPNQEGLYQHFKLVADASSKPIVLYNVPGRTGVNILPTTTLRIAADCPNVVGIKEASGNIDQITEIINSKPADFAVISGDDALTCELMKRGADGVISVVSNALPAQIATIVKDSAKRDKIDAQIAPLYHLFFKEGNPVGVKGYMSQRGLIGNYLRLPLVPASEKLLNELIKF